MITKKILFLTAYDYSQAFEGLDSVHFRVLVPENEPMLSDAAYCNLKQALDDKLDVVKYQDVEKFVGQYQPDILITFGWRRIVSDSLLSMSKLNVNVHPAILPQYKGYHPVPHVLLNNEQEHGITAHVITDKLDAGEIIYIEKFAINKFSTLKSLQAQVNTMMPSFVQNLLKKLLNDNVTLIENHDSDTVIVAGKRTPNDSEISADTSLEKAFDLVRACDSDRFPAYFYINDQKVYVKLYRDIEAERINIFDI